MIISQLIQVLEDWAPRWAAMKHDNVGLQVGNPSRRVSRVLIALELTPAIIDEALARKAELIITHHPLLFRPPASITSSDPVGKLVLRLAENRIAVYAAHTNLDFSKDGVSFALAQKLSLQNIRFLSPLKDTLAKIIVFVPEPHTENLRNAMANAGAGIIGAYSHCSFVSHGSGTFKGSKQTKPFVGKAGTLEHVDEVRLEMIAPRANVEKIISAMKDIHPYEEVAYDVLFSEARNANFGIGAIGELAARQSLKQFLKNTKKALHCEAVRFTGNVKNQVQRIAVCGGSGSEVLSEALRAHADVLVTADVKYHTFHAAAETIALVDAGHWETEHIVLRAIAGRIQQAVQQANAPLRVYITDQSTNPVQTM